VFNCLVCVVKKIVVIKTSATLIAAIVLHRNQWWCYFYYTCISKTLLFEIIHTLQSNEIYTCTLFNMSLKVNFDIAIEGEINPMWRCSNHSQDFLNHCWVFSILQVWKCMHRITFSCLCVGKMYWTCKRVSLFSTSFVEKIFCFSMHLAS
jgi:hypothetical protein